MKNYFRILTLLLVLAALFLSGQSAQAQAGAVAVPGQILIYLPGGTNADEAKRIATEAKCRVLGELAYSPGYYLLEEGATRVVVAGKPGGKTRAVTAAPVTAAVNAAVQKIKTNPGVLAAPNFVKKAAQTTLPPPAGGIPPITPNDPRFGEQWGLRLINMPEAYALQRGIRPVIIAIIDSGFDIDHEDFQRNGVRNFLTPISLLNPLAPDQNVADSFGHGVHVAGTAAAITNNTTGVASVAGFNGGSVNITLLPIRTLGDNGSGTDASSVAGINYAVAQGAGVVNMSYGAEFGNSDVELQAIQNGIAAGTVFVAALGNDGREGSNFFPANYPGVISVSAVGIDARLSSYSNFGGNVAIAAPGGDFDNGVGGEILSTYPRNLVSSGYFAISGTSMASPHVAGAAALLLAIGVQPANIKAALQNSARTLEEIPDFNGGNQYGAGLLDVAAALRPYVLPTPFLLGSDGRSFTPSGQPINDRGVTLDRQFPIFVSVVSASLVTAPSNIVVRVVRIGEGDSEVARYVGGVDFDVPPTAPLQTVTLQVPRASTPPITLSDGRYRIEVIITNNGIVSTDTQFATVRSQFQRSGLQLFALPYRVSDVSTTPERAVFGGDLAPAFTLFRWDVFTGSYATFFSGGGQNVKASFRATTLDDGRITSFDTTAPGVSIAPVGLGYWLNLPAGSVAITPAGARVTSPVGVNLVGPTGPNPSGWNLVGNPYTFAVDWNSVVVQSQGVNYTLLEAVAAEVIEPFIVGYDPVAGDYFFGAAPGGQLLPFNGYWVQANRDLTVVFSPAVSGSIDNTRAAATVAATATRSNILPQPANGWRARLMASVAGDRDGQNYFGQVSGAQNGKDRHDITKPPSGAGHAYVRFIADGKNNTKAAYAVDMRPSSNGIAGKQEWTVAVTSDKSEANVTLSWDGLNHAPRRSRFFLKDNTGGQRIALGSRSAYTFKSGEAGSTRMFTLSMETQGSGGALAFLSPHVSRTSVRGVASTMLRFRTNREASVLGVVRTSGGKVVAQMRGTSRATGQQEATLRWDGKSEKGAQVPIGGYVMDVTIRDDNGETASLRMPIMSAR